MMYSAYKLNKQGDNIQPWCPPFPIWNQFVFPHPALTVASWPAYRLLRRQVRWSGIPISFRIFYSLFHTVKSFDIANKAELNVFLELSCFFDDPAMLAIWSLVPLLFLNPAWTSGSSRLKPGLENFEDYFANVWDECNCAVTWTFFGIVFPCNCNENWPFLVLCQLLSFLNLLAYWVKHFHSIIF